jgi:hypothetical protein
MLAANKELRSSRGAVAGIASIDASSEVIEYAGIGNTECRVLGGAKSMRLVSLNGMLGLQSSRIRVFSEKLPKPALILLATDGISDRWDVDIYPGLWRSHPQLICAVIARDFGRLNDDATIVCGRILF